MIPRFPPLAAAVLAALAAGGPLSAQDATVVGPVWVLPSPPPDGMPTINRFFFSPSFPRDLRDTPEIGYAEFIEFIPGANPGKRLMIGGDVFGTGTLFQQAVHDAHEDFSLKAAKRGGAPVDTVVWVAVVFNPASAARHGPDATPRLLQPTPVFVGPRRTGGRREPFAVRVRISVDATGAVARALAESEEDDDIMPPVARAVRHWRFAPARQGGQPVAADVTMPVIVEAPVRMGGPASKPPIVVKQVQPEYPVSMRYLGLRGEVELDFVVEPDGTVANPTIVNSNNPVFDEPAVEALRQWKFQPGERNGQPVAVHMSETISFELNDTPNGGDSAYRTSSESGGGAAATVHGALFPVFPYELRRQDVSGTATVKALVDEQGRVRRVEVASASRPEFGLALAAALDGFSFLPAVKDGRPVRSIVQYSHDFSDPSQTDPEGYYALSRERRHPESIHLMNELDAPLRPISRRPGIFPSSLMGKVTEGSALVEFLIDPDGHARIPRIVRADDPLFGYAAVQAVSAWWFDPPKIHGKPVYVRVQVPFLFRLQKPS